MKQLLDRIQSFLFTKGDKTEIDHFIKLKVCLYKTYGKGFYVNAPSHLGGFFCLNWYKSSKYTISYTKTKS